MSTTTTFYASDNAGIGVDTTTSYATAHDATAGTGINKTGAQNDHFSRKDGSWWSLYRAFCNFDTSAIGSGKTIISATAGAYGKSKGGTINPSHNVYGSTASDTLAAGDYDLCGTTAYCDTAISRSSWSTSGYNTFAFNSTGLTAISPTGKTKIVYREIEGDVSNTTPSADSAYYISDYQIDNTGTSKDPYLQVVYDDAAAATFIPQIIII
jgi:hypothetical protein